MNHSNRWDDAVIIALGSNLAGDYPSSYALMEAALSRFPDEGLNVANRSLWWRSAAWPDQALPEYLNGIAFVETLLAPRELLLALLRIEAQFGRVRGKTNAPRTLDLDLIAHGRLVVDDPILVLPHPRAVDRVFVMGPLTEIAPNWRHPVTGAKAVDLLKLCTVGAGSVAVG